MPSGWACASVRRRSRAGSVARCASLGRRVPRSAANRIEALQRRPRSTAGTHDDRCVAESSPQSYVEAMQLGAAKFREASRSRASDSPCRAKAWSLNKPGQSKNGSGQGSWTGSIFEPQVPSRIRVPFPRRPERPRGSCRALARTRLRKFRRLQPARQRRRVDIQLNAKTRPGRARLRSTTVRSAEHPLRSPPDHRPERPRWQRSARNRRSPTSPNC